MCWESQGSVVCIMSRLQAGLPRIHGSIPGRGRYSFCVKCPYRLWGSLVLIFSQNWGCLLGSKVLEA